MAPVACHSLTPLPPLRWLMLLTADATAPTHRFACQAHSHLSAAILSLQLHLTGRNPLSWRSFRLGRQEDAHEFLIALLDAMHEASIAGMQPKPPPELAHTSFIYRIFGGRMRSQVGTAQTAQARGGGGGGEGAAG